MKWERIAGVLAAALALSFAGCAATPEPVEDSVPQRQVVDTLNGSAYPYAPESPAIDDLAALSGGVQAVDTAVSASRETRAVWISYLELANLLGKKTEAEFTSNIRAVFDNVKSYGLNTVIVHVRPFGDALYESDYFPWSYLITGTEGQKPGFDPLAIMVREAKARGLEIEAWINPYRVRAKDNNNALSGNNPARTWLDSGSGAVRNYNGVISYNPASQSARELIVNGAAELVRKYEIDGIHIDDYFYPTTDAAFDKSSYDSYQSGGGKLSLADWRRQNVEKLVKAMYDAIKAEDKTVRFGISPQSSVDNNYNVQYLDVNKIAGNNGYCDYICPQIYFGYQNDAQPYLKTLEMWQSMVAGTNVRLYVGIAPYKIGKTDSWAGSGKNEWATSTDLMRRMVDDARRVENYTGFVLYRYDSVFNPETAVKSSVQAENENLRSIL